MPTTSAVHLGVGLEQKPGLAPANLPQRAVVGPAGKARRPLMPPPSNRGYGPFAARPQERSRHLSQRGREGRPPPPASRDPCLPATWRSSSAPSSAPTAVRQPGRSRISLLSWKATITTPLTVGGAAATSASSAVVLPLRGGPVTMKPPGPKSSTAGPRSASRRPNAKPAGVRSIELSGTSSGKTRTGGAGVWARLFRYSPSSIIASVWASPLTSPPKSAT